MIIKRTVRGYERIYDIKVKRLKDCTIDGEFYCKRFIAYVYRSDQGGKLTAEGLMFSSEDEAVRDAIKWINWETG